AAANKAATQWPLEGMKTDQPLVEQPRQPDNAAQPVTRDAATKNADHSGADHGSHDHSSNDHGTDKKQASLL
ncbi:MAG: hypothetical protein AAF213_02850, partial [Pseudomonadota bacterium]